MSKIVAHVGSTSTAAQVGALYKTLTELAPDAAIEIVADDLAVEEEAVHAGPPPSYDYAGVTQMTRAQLAQAVQDATLRHARAAWPDRD